MRRKLKNEVKQSGIAPQMSECEQALEYIIEKEDAAEELHNDDLEMKKTLQMTEWGKKNWEGMQWKDLVPLKRERLEQNEGK